MVATVILPRPLGPWTDAEVISAWRFAWPENVATDAHILEAWEGMRPTPVRPYMSFEAYTFIANGNLPIAELLRGAVFCILLGILPYGWTEAEVELYDKDKCATLDPDYAFKKVTAEGGTDFDALAGMATFAIGSEWRAYDMPKAVR